jgi:pyruvate formate-lyase/glycerol dehydratase family glycyl radical enzyme
MRRSSTHLVLGALLRLMALTYNVRPRLRRQLSSDFGPIEFSVGFKTEDGSAEGGLIFKGGRIKACGRVPAGADVTLVFASDEVVKEMLRITPNEVLILLMKNRLRTEGNLTYLSLFNYYLSLLLGEHHRKLMARQQAARPRPERTPGATAPPPRRSRLVADRVDPGVHHLDDPYLSRYTLEDFPRLQRFLDAHFTIRPELCAERALLVTQWHRANGFEVAPNGEAWHPTLRQGHVLKHLLEHKQPLIREGDLIAGTTTGKQVGVVVYPDAQGTLIWGELRTLPHRELNPYDVSEQTALALHREVLPYWTERNFREWVRHRYAAPVSQQLDERFAVYFMWKTVALSHTIPDFPALLRHGTRGLIAEIDTALASLTDPPPGAAETLQGMRLTLEGLATYAQNLSKKAAEEAAAAQQDPVRRGELERLAEVCARVPEQPARTLDEALNALWIAWVALHMESTNAGLSLGRLDQWLQPFFEADMAALTTAEQKEAYLRRALELVGCFFLRATDHLPLSPDIGNYLFGGSSSDQAITVGGVTPEGEDAVCDMTYVLLKVTELLGLRDPNVNARFHPEKNSDTYLRRLCEVNLITAATPSLHNDAAVLLALESLPWSTEDARDWAATGCVEPTICGKHMGHTNSMMMNLVAALEMALNDGRHPLMRWSVGPRTGRVEDGAFRSFEQFYEAFCAQLGFLIDKAVEYNNLLGEAHAHLRPTPLLSSLIDGCLQSGKDVTLGGARYNSSGAACIGLADVTDSLLAVKKLVFDEGTISFERLKRAVDTDFKQDAALQAMIGQQVEAFGSGSEPAVQMARRVAQWVHERYARHRNFRGGPYTAGFWSMSNHVAFGTLTGALPSGRRAGKPFTPGLTPQPGASKSLLDNLRDVAALDARAMPNNMAFNVKVVPSADEPHDRAVETMRAYAAAYFGLGGMQMQMNVVTSAMMRDAMAHPENYRNLLVRISGYNAYFVTLNRDMQLELIERAEFGAAA